MNEKERAKLRSQIEQKAEERGWSSRYRVTVRNSDTGQAEIVEVPGRDAWHASRTNAIMLVEMRLRGETVEYDAEEL